MTVQGTDSNGKVHNLGEVVFDLAPYIKSSQRIKLEPIDPKKKEKTKVVQGLELGLDIIINSQALNRHKSLDRTYNLKITQSKLEYK